MTDDLDRLGAWADLPFFAETWPVIAARLAADPREILPRPANRFAALERVPPDDVRVVILGQDPYHQSGKADGLAFSIPDAYGRRRRDSLAVILDELADDLGERRDRTDLSDWADQGVLLLNTGLTVPAGVAKGHAGIGWGALVADVLRRTSRRPTAFHLWGGPARRFRRHIDGDGHLIVETGHPSPLNTAGGFRGTRPFSRTNAWLAGRGEAPIDWIGGS